MSFFFRNKCSSVAGTQLYLDVTMLGQTPNENKTLPVYNLTILRSHTNALQFLKRLFAISKFWIPTLISCRYPSSFSQSCCREKAIFHNKGRIIPVPKLAWEREQLKTKQKDAKWSRNVLLERLCLCVNPFSRKVCFWSGWQSSWSSAK